MILLSCMKRFIQIVFIFFPDVSTLSKFQREEYAKLWFNLALLILGSFVIKILEPGNQKVDIYTFGAILEGLTGFFICVRIALSITKKR